MMKEAKRIVVTGAAGTWYSEDFITVFREEGSIQGCIYKLV